MSTVVYPTISLCMIVRDEEDWLDQCLESVAPVVTEVILVDTGSTDGTLEIGKRFNAKVFSFEWNDDFSAARNISLQHATCDWVLVLDADEAIAQRDLKSLQDLTLKQGVCYEFLQRHYTNDPRLSDFKPCQNEFPEFERSYPGYFESNLCRLFPNHRGIHYRGRIHELVEHSIKEIPGLRVERCAIRIHHFGHTPEVKKKKTKAALYGPLGETKVREQPTDWKAFFELGVEHNCNGRLAESADAFEQSVRLNANYIETWVNYGYVLCELARYQEAENALKRAIALSPRNDQAFCNLAVVFMRQRNFPKAIEMLMRAVQINPRYVNAFCNLGVCFAHLGRLSESANAYMRAIEAMPQCVSAKADLGALYLNVGELEEAEKYLRLAIQDDEACSRALFNLAALLKREQRNEEAADTLERYYAVEIGKAPLSQELAAQLEAVKREIAVLREALVHRM